MGLHLLLINIERIPRFGIRWPCWKMRAYMITQHPQHPQHPGLLAAPSSCSLIFFWFFFFCFFSSASGAFPSIPVDCRIGDARFEPARANMSGYLSSTSWIYRGISVPNFLWWKMNGIYLVDVGLVLVFKRLPLHLCLGQSQIRAQFFRSEISHLVITTLLRHQYSCPPFDVWIYWLLICFEQRSTLLKKLDRWFEFLAIL